MSVKLLLIRLKVSRKKTVLASERVSSVVLVKRKISLSTSEEVSNDPKNDNVWKTDERVQRVSKQTTSLEIHAALLRRAQLRERYGYGVHSSAKHLPTVLFAAWDKSTARRSSSFRLPSRTLL